MNLIGLVDHRGGKEKVFYSKGGGNWKFTELIAKDMYHLASKGWNPLSVLGNRSQLCGTVSPKGLLGNGTDCTL